MFGDVAVGISVGYAPVDYRYETDPRQDIRINRIFCSFSTRAEIHPVVSLELSSWGTW